MGRVSSKAWREPSREDRGSFAPQAVFEAGLRNHHVSNTAYPIAHERTWRGYRVPRRDVEAAAVRAWDGVEELGLYLHVPFCETRCSFCEYTVTRRSEHSAAAAYVTALLGEMALYNDVVGAEGRRLHGLDIGGGTPSFLPAEFIGRLLEAARSRFRFAPGADVSIETTPKIAAAEPEKLAAYRLHGVDRISMGIQVIQPDLLKVLNREGNGAELHRRAVDNVRGAGFERLNLDLMYGFRDQSLESWRQTLEHAIGLDPEYVTLYRMRYKLTRISHQAPDVTLEQIRPMVALAKSMLSHAGYEAPPGKTTYSRIRGDVGTSSYLARRVVDGMPYLGLGLGAQSFTHTSIAYNEGAAGKNLAPYLRSVAEERLPVQDFYDLPAVQMMGKMCSVSFYFGAIHLAAFREKFGVALEEAYPEAVAYLLSEGLMEYRDDVLGLTGKGVEHKSGVHALFYAPSIQAYLLERDPERPEDMERNRRRAAKTAEEALVHG